MIMLKQESQGWFGFIPGRWKFPCLIALGIFAGLGLAVAHISRASSYLSDDPETCVNCHVMFSQYMTWQHSSHARVAVCNDCHVPHSSIAAHYVFKAMDGLKHSAVFTLRLEPQVITASAAALPVLESNCLRCHNRVMEEVRHFDASGRLCWECHRETPHGGVYSLSATPHTLNPQLPAIGFRDYSHRIGGRPPRIDE
jgi:cytochrome c nitrite reductase small subunit